MPLLDHFIKNSVNEVRKASDHPDGELSYLAFYQKFLPAIAHRNADHIYQYSESPIERIFLASLQLLFIKSEMPCLHISPPARDAEAYMKDYRQTHLGILQMIENYEAATGDTELVRFDAAVQHKLQKGDFTQDNVQEIQIHRSIVPHFEWNSYHLIPQAGLPDVKVNGRSIRCDLLLWVPGDESVKVVIECDGYAYHNSKENFTNDRIRDRQLQMHG
ncbi:MAG: hypothetical protein ACO1NU_08475 [Arcticibacter sp.]